MTRAAVLSVACGEPSRRGAFKEAAVVFRGFVTAIEDPDWGDPMWLLRHAHDPYRFTELLSNMYGDYYGHQDE